jgi:chromosome segregation protein
VARERVAAQKSDRANWQARAGDAAQRLAGMAQRFEEIARSAPSWPPSPPA